MNSPPAMLREHWRAFAAMVAITTDALVVILAFLAAFLFTSPGMSRSDALAIHLPLLALSLVVFIGSCTSLGLYRVIGHAPVRRHAAVAGRAYLYGTTATLGALFVGGWAGEQRLLAGTFFLLLPLVYAAAWTMLRFILRRAERFRLGRWKTLVMGVDPSTDRVLRRVQACPELGYDVVRVVMAEKTPDGFLRFDRPDLERAVQECRAEMILLSSSQVNGSFVHLEEICRAGDIRVSILSRESDDLFIRTRIHDLAGIPLFWPEHRRVEAFKRLVKRAFDLTVSALLLVGLSPLFLFIAVAAKLESPGPVIFRQKRALSSLEPPFEFYKFRSMTHAAAVTNRILADKNESDGALFKIRNDPRLTRVGRFIRRHSLDELPQLLNVLKGEMSLVGPRPLPVEDFAHPGDRDHLDGFVRHRGRTKPGMTGLWQISGRSDLGFREMVLLDLYYIQHQTILFDIEILAQTLPVVLFGKGAY